MHDRKNESSNDPRQDDQDPQDDQDRRDQRTNAFAPHFFEHLARRDFHPATPEADHAGPWRVVKLHGEGPVRFACFAAGERSPRLSFEAPDLAYLAAATLHLTDRPPRFRWQRGAERRGQGGLHLMHDGYPVATAGPAAQEAESLPQDLTRLADLRVQPLALAQFLLSVPDEVIKRAGELVMELLEEAK
jgi:hypothetical protein